ncbi:MAG: PDZ domain-containing protein [Phycisphaerales bacterium]|jgi:hypothetical protein|nr:PDZ domain-containing protein [Phycisphaerales bacterium]
MKRFAIAVLVMILAAPFSGLANTLPAGKDTAEFMVGVTGINADIKGGVLRVTKITPKTPAENKLQAGDVLLAVDGARLDVQDPRHPLGFAINKAEGRDGRMKFSILRGKAKMTVVIQLEAIGSYSPAFPANCKKSKRIVDDTAAFLLKNGGPGGGINGNLEGLFLLSTGEKKYMPAIEAYAVKLASGNAGASVWSLGYSGIFLGEYYLATGDKRVLPALKTRCDTLARGQYYGGWGHGAQHCGPGYVTGGLLNAAGDQGLTTLVIARECGVDVSDTAYNDALRFFFRFAGRGGVPYGDHHTELWPSTNGKSGGLASALTLLPGKKFQGGAKMLALAETDSYFDSEGGHGSCFGNLTWRNIVDALVIDTHKKSYRRHKDELIWHFELSRMPGGGFKTPTFPGQRAIGKAPLHQTGLIAMGYTSHLKNLRICGKPRTKYSVKHKPTAVELSLETDDFHLTGHVGGVVISETPEEIAAAFLTLYDADGKKSKRGGNASKNDARKKQMPVDWYFKIMHHYSPAFRAWAANGLGYQGQKAIGTIKKALASKDGRLRVAGLNAIRCTTGWGAGKTKSNITSEMIKEHFLAHLVKTLKDPKTPVWERRHALLVMDCCDAETVKACIPLIKPYLTNSEWWLRCAAFLGLAPLIDDTETFRSLLPTMLASYHADTNLPSRRWGVVTVFKKAIATNPKIKDELVAGMARSINRTPVREGFKQPIDLNNIFETLRYVNMKKNPAHAIGLLPAIERIFPKLESLPAYWTLTGARWGNIGLIKAAEKLGKDAKPFIATMKRLAPNVALRTQNGRRAEMFKEAQTAMNAAIKAHEAKYGVVKIK